MSTFDEQTDFSFLGISVDEPVKQARSKQPSHVDIGGHTISIGLTHNRTLSAEARAKLSAAKTGRTIGPMSAETRAKIGAANRGKIRDLPVVRPPDIGLRISLGKAQPIATPLGHFRRAREAAQAHDIDVVTIYRRILKYPNQYYYTTKD